MRPYQRLVAALLTEVDAARAALEDGDLETARVHADLATALATVGDADAGPGSDGAHRRDRSTAVREWAASKRAVEDDLAAAAARQRERDMLPVGPVNPPVPPGRDPRAEREERIRRRRNR